MPLRIQRPIGVQHTIRFLVLLTASACSGRMGQPPDAGDSTPVDADGDADGDDAGAIDADLDDATDADPDAEIEGPVLPSGPVCVFVDEAQGRATRDAGEDFFAPYITEVLSHAGVPHVVLIRAELSGGISRCPVLVLAHETTTSEAELAALDRYVRDGGMLVALGGTSGLGELLGVEAVQPMAEGYIDVLEGDEPLLPPAPLPLHVFGGVGTTVGAAEPAALWLDEAGDPTEQVAVSRRTLDAGEAWLVGPDLVRSVVAIQQGQPIHADGAPAPDGTAAIDDGILKTDDGIVLDWVMDRGLVAGEPLFLEPVADLLRELLLSLVFRGNARVGNPLPVLWYWPGDLDAVGAISHDSDGNDPALARALLAEVESLGIDTTWCFMRYPESYPAELFAEIAAAGGEVAFHYDARTGSADTTWSEANFLSQLAWLVSLSGATVTTNKNHYLRWEGWTDFYRWMESAGLQADQSKGPSKRGNVGFLYGSCHPFFPIDDAAHENRVIDVLGVNLFTQDLVHTCSYEVGPALVDRTAEHFGVAHFLFHPAHVHRAGVADAMRSVVEYGESLGLEWWTIARLNDWERARRRVTFTDLSRDGFVLESPEPLEDATFLVVLGSTADAPEIRVDSNAVEWEPFTVYGAGTARFTVDLPGGRNAVAIARGD
jgi:hypothetical protein